LTVCALGVVFTGTGFVIAAYPAFDAANRMITLPSDNETNSMFQPADEQTTKIEQFLKNHPVAQELRNNPEYIESRPHMKITEEMRAHSLTAGTLLGPGKIWVPPITFTHKNGDDITILAYLGSDLSGHPGVVHGGCMATLIDEGFARCCFGKLPNKIGMTANLNINYKAPLPTDSYICLRGRTIKVDGRKAWVEGHLESLAKPGQAPTVHCNATALFIEPRQTAVSFAERVTSLWLTDRN
jgi:3'-phosphoadenosine 5'-phosphosulfate synthase